MTVITITPKYLSASEERGASIWRAQAGADIDLEHPVVYIDSDGKVRQASALAAATALAVGIAVFPDNFYAEDTIKSGNWVGVVVHGPVYVGENSTLTNGELLYVDKTTAGDLNDVAPTDAYQFVVGRAQGSDTIFVSPGTSSPVSA